MSDSYIKLPPDSTGKSIRTVSRTTITLLSVLVDLDNIDYAATVTGLTSGATGKFTGFGIELGRYDVVLADLIGEFEDGEDIKYTDVSGEFTIGTISDIQSYYTSTTILTDPDSPNNRQSVDRGGSAYVRFKDGNTQFDAFGNTQVSQLHTIDSFSYLYTSHDELFKDVQSGGSIIHNSGSSQLKLSVDSNSGSVCSRTTKRYFSYTPGEGLSVIMTVGIGDAGKDEVVRRWGFFDDDDGLYFELSGSSFNVNIRNSSTGGTDTTVTRDDFNGDTLSEAGQSSFIIDFTKINLYWIDYQWLGAGRARFGVISPQGEKVVIHSFENANRRSIPYMKSGTLPLRWEQLNIGTSASTSEMNLLCATVQRQSVSDHSEGHEFTFSPTSSISVPTGSDVPLISFQSKDIMNGLPNKSFYKATEFEFYSDNEAIEVSIIVNPQLTGSLFAESLDQSTLNIDVNASSLLNGTKANIFLQSQGISIRSIPNITKNFSQVDLDNPIIYTVAARSLGSGPTNVLPLMRWVEIA